jgi:hypothetical protein
MPSQLFAVYAGYLHLAVLEGPFHVHVIRDTLSMGLPLYFIPYKYESTESGVTSE